MLAVQNEALLLKSKDWVYIPCDDRTLRPISYLYRSLRLYSYKKLKIHGAPQE